jgi:hypothetical protein
MNFQFATADENGISSGIFRRDSEVGGSLRSCLQSPPRTTPPESPDGSRGLVKVRPTINRGSSRVLEKPATCGVRKSENRPAPPIGAHPDCQWGKTSSGKPSTGVYTSQVPPEPVLGSRFLSRPLLFRIIFPTESREELRKLTDPIG